MHEYHIMLDGFPMGPYSAAEAQQKIAGRKHVLVWREGFFLARLRGPGKVWMQSLPFSRLAGRLAEALPERGGDKGED